MAETSVHQGRRAGMVECFRHEGEDCARCDGAGQRPRRCCEGCGEPSGRPSQGAKALLGLRNRRGKDQPVYSAWAVIRSSGAALGGLAAELKVVPLPHGDALKLVGGVVLLAAMWRWTMPRSARGRSLPRRR